MKSFFAAALGGLLFPAVFTAGAADRPNVIFLLTDDQGWGDAAAWGHPYHKTPNLDRLTREGTRVSQFYVANPVCSPSRTAFMTGRYPARFSVHGHFSTREQNAARHMPDWLDPQASTVTRLLQQSGYATGHFGKWHLGHGEGAPLPAAYGIDRHITTVSNDPKFPTDMPHPWGQYTRMIMDNALAFIREHKDAPFYVNIWTLIPHAKLDPTPEQLAVYEELRPRADDPAFGEWAQGYYAKARDLRSQMQIFSASITDLDTQVGRLLDALKELELDEKTLFIYSSDNGPEDYNIGNASNAGVGNPGPFRARKRSIYEGGVRVPFVARWPGKIKPGVFDEKSVIGSVDFLPTLCAITGVKPPEGVRLDGEDVSDILLGGAARPRKGPLYWEWRSRVAGDPEYAPPPLVVRDAQWKLLTDKEGKRVELYDIPSDPGERNNLASANPEIVARLSKLALDWKATLPPGEEEPLPPRKASTKGKAASDRGTIFDGKDKNKDGRLTLEEYLNNFPDQDEGRRRFPTFDTDGNGTLTKEEFARAGRRK